MSSASTQSCQNFISSALAQITSRKKIASDSSKKPEPDIIPSFGFVVKHILWNFDDFRCIFDMKNVSVLEDFQPEIFFVIYRLDS